MIQKSRKGAHNGKGEEGEERNEKRGKQKGQYRPMRKENITKKREGERGQGGVREREREREHPHCPGLMGDHEIPGQNAAAYANILI